MYDTNTLSQQAWSSWFSAPCSVTCGNGTLTRLRHCSSGRDADCGTGSAFEAIACNARHCPGY